MDGYAVRAADVARLPATLAVDRRGARRTPFRGALGTGQAVRIFTGAPVPDGRRRDRHPGGYRPRAATRSSCATARRARAHIRTAGGDFRAGDTLLAAGRRLDAAAISLAAAMGHGEVPVRRPPAGRHPVDRRRTGAAGHAAWARTRSSPPTPWAWRRWSPRPAARRGCSASRGHARRPRSASARRRGRRRARHHRRRVGRRPRPRRAGARSHGA